MADGNAAPKRTWSPMQDAIFAAVAERPTRNLVVEALAGTGKTTTTEEAVHRTDPAASVLVCAFNASIAKELKARMPEDVDTATIHSFGYRALREAAPSRIEVDSFATANEIQGLMGRERSTLEARTFVKKVIEIAKGQAFRPMDHGDQLGILDKWADAFGIDAPKGWDRFRLLATAQRLLRSQASRIPSVIDYDDMIWLPLVRELKLPRYDVAFVDETQDLNPAQLEIVVAAGKRVIAVGDRHQSIYGFRGADREAIPRMIRELEAETLPLSITYRCASRIVEEAQEYVPQFEAALGAPEGIVREASPEELERDVRPGDFVLSRTNAPLISLCFRLVASGRKAAIQGRDVGAGLAAWVKSNGASSVPELMRGIATWRAAEVERLEAAERPVDHVIEKAACLEALCSGASSVGDVVSRIERVFTSDAPGDRILLSSTHRAKGLEASRVWLLWDTYLQRAGDEEQNLAYVAITRAKSELIYVTEFKGE